TVLSQGLPVPASDFLPAGLILSECFCKTPAGRSCPGMGCNAPWHCRCRLRPCTGLAGRTWAYLQSIFKMPVFVRF
ncbi:MAG: hypothetical protein KBT00_03460, partial [Bacteroidales bacterium]|nr:hypothetical protein [Candidatus Cacconaster merdequi]